MAETINVGVLRALLTLDSATYEAGMRDAGKTAKQFTREMNQIGQQMTNLGSRMTAAISLPIVAGFGAASKAAIDFESSFAGVRKTVDATEAEFKVMSQGLRDLAKQIPIDVNELNKLAEAAGALGIPKKDIIDFTRVMAELGVTTNVTAEQAANDIAKIQNIFGASGQATENFASALVDLGNKGASTEQEILGLATRIASAGATVGLTQAQVLGFSAAIANVGMEAEAGGSAMSRVLNELSKAASLGGKELAAFAKVAEMSASGFAKLFKEDASAATVKFIEGLGKIKASGADLNVVLSQLGFTELRQSDLLRRLAGDATGVATAVRTSTEAWRENSALSKEAGERFKTTESQLLLLWARLKDVAITIGVALLPAIQTAVKVFDALVPWLEAAAKAFAAMPGPLQAVVLGFLALAAAAGPLLIILGQMSIGMAALAGVGGMGGLLAAIGKVIGPLGFGGLATAARAALPVLTSWGAAFELVKGAITGFLGIGARVLSFFTSWSTVAGAAVRVLGALRLGISLLLGPIGILTAAIVLLGPKLWELVGGWEGIKDALSSVGSLFADVGTIVYDMASRGIQFAIDKLAAFLRWLEEIRSKIPGWGSDVKTEIESVKEPSIGLGAAWENLAKIAGDVFGSVREDLRLTAQAIRDVKTNLDLLEKSPAHKEMERSWKTLTTEMQAKPITDGLAIFEQELAKIPKPITHINALLGDTDAATKAARKAAKEADEAHREWGRTVAANTKVFELQAREAEKFLKQQEKELDHKNTLTLRSYAAITDAERSFSKESKEIQFQRADYAIEQAKRQGASWQQVYAMETELSRERLRSAIEDAELEFEARTTWINKGTTEGKAAYDALRRVHDANVQGMVEKHQQGEAIKRDELDRTHNVWRRTIESAKALVDTLTDSMSENFGRMLTGAQGFKETFVNIWRSIQQHLTDILSDLLDYFISTFLKGMIGAMLGQQGAFSSAFSGIMGGFGGGGGGGGIAMHGGGALLGLLGIGGGNAATAGVLAGNAGILGAMGGGSVAAGGAAGGAAAGGGMMAGMGALMTNPWTIGVAAALLGGLAIWKSGIGRGGEEGTQVNPARDALFQTYQDQFGGDQFSALAAAFADAGVSGDIAERLIADLYRADEMDEFRAAAQAIQDSLSGAREAAEAVSGVVDTMGAAMLQFETTIASVEATGAVSEEAITALRAAISGLQTSGVTADTVAILNETLEKMIAAGTVSDETIGALVAQVENLTATSGDNQTQVEDTTVATDALTEAQRWFQENLRNTMITSQDFAAQLVSLREQFAQPIQMPEIILPEIRIPDYVSSGPSEPANWLGEVPSFANEGIVRSPMAAIVGDANEPEWILHESSVLALLRRGMAFGASLADAAGTPGETPGPAGASSGGGDTYNVALELRVEYSGQESPEAFARRVAVALPRAVPVALRRDDGLRRKVRGAVK